MISTLALRHLELMACVLGWLRSTKSDLVPIRALRRIQDLVGELHLGAFAQANALCARVRSQVLLEAGE